MNKYSYRAVVYLVRGFDRVRVWLIGTRAWGWYVRRKFDGIQTNWLQNPETRKRIQVMIGYGGCHRIPKGCDSIILPLTKYGRFTPEVGRALLARVQPAFIPHELFLEQLGGELYSARGSEDMMCRSWHLGVDERGELCVHAHQAVDVELPPVSRKRAEVVKLRFGVRGTARFANGRVYVGDDEDGVPDHDITSFF